MHLSIKTWSKKYFFRYLISILHISILYLFNINTAWMQKGKAYVNKDCTVTELNILPLRGTSGCYGNPSLY